MPLVTSSWPNDESPQLFAQEPCLRFSSPIAILQRARASNKKHILSLLAQRASQWTLASESQILSRLIQRESLGSTGIGGGVAIPHARLRYLPVICGVFGRLEQPIPFSAPDDQPVDLVFLILAPECAGVEHLKSMARVARFFQDKERRQHLRAAYDEAALSAILADALPQLQAPVHNVFTYT
jgi:PTS system nitrogen regulatory IIA component